MLTQAQIAQYHDKGYVVPDYRLSPETLACIKRDYDRLLERYPAFRDNCSALLSYDMAFMNYARDPNILDMAEQLIGPDIALWNMSFFAKPALNGKKTPYHQDGEYWPIRPLATCSAWIALDDATPENGCLRVIPGSHKQRRLRAHTQKDNPDLVLNQELNADEYDEADAADIVLEAGQLSLHDVYLVHGSEPNRSTRRRAGYVCRYMPTGSHFDHGYGAELQKRSGQVDFSGRPLWLMRGKDVCGKNDFAVGH